MKLLINILTMKGETKMEVKKGENTYSVPAWVIAVGAATVGAIVTDICKTVAKVKSGK